MNVTEFKVGDRFITSQLPLDRALLYGITCKEIIVSGEDTNKNPAQVVFSRDFLESQEKEFNFRADSNGEVNIGMWIKRPILEDIKNEN